MQHIKGIARDQISFNSFEDRISKDNPVRFIDVFVANAPPIKLNDLRKHLKTINKEMRESRTGKVMSKNDENDLKFFNFQ